MHAGPFRLVCHQDDQLTSGAGLASRDWAQPRHVQILDGKESAFRDQAGSRLMGKGLPGGDNFRVESADPLLGLTPAVTAPLIACQRPLRNA